MAHYCPIDGTQINEPTVRVVAFLVAITAALGVVYQSPFFFLFLAFDFLIRGFYNKKWSLFRFIGLKTTDYFDVKVKLIDAGGKKFAARIGLVFSIILTLAAYFQLLVVVYSLGGILVLFAVLESALAYCVGCKMHTLYRKIVFNLSGITGTNNEATSKDSSDYSDKSAQVVTEFKSEIPLNKS
jgi:hypothetical protein